MWRGCRWASFRSYSSQLCASRAHVSNVLPSASPSALKADSNNAVSDIGSMNQAQRMLRRLPVGRTGSTFYFNELSRPLKAAVLHQLHRMRQRPTERRKSSRGDSLGPAHSTATAAPPLELAKGMKLTQLNAPHFRLASASLQHLFNSAEKTARQLARELTSGTDASFANDLMALRCAFASLNMNSVNDSNGANRHGDDGEGGGAILCEPLVFVPDASMASARLGVRLASASSSPKQQPPQQGTSTAGKLAGRERTASARACPPLMLTTESTAPRVDYQATPEIYVIGIPEYLLRNKEKRISNEERNETAVDNVEEEDASEDSCIERFLQRRLVFDNASGQLLLVTPTPTATTAGRSGSSSSSDGTFLGQMYAFDAQAAIEAAKLAGASDGETAYRLMFLSRLPHMLHHASDAFPCTFRGYTVDVFTTEKLMAPALTRSHRDGQPHQIGLQLWARMSAKRLTAAPGTVNRPSLWTTQEFCTTAARAAVVVPAKGDASNSNRSNSFSDVPAHAEAKAGQAGPHLLYRRTVQRLLRERAEELVHEAGEETAADQAIENEEEEQLTSTACSPSLSSEWERGPYVARFKRLFHKPSKTGHEALHRLVSSRGERVSIRVLEPLIGPQPPQSSASESLSSCPDTFLADAVSKALGSEWLVPPTAVDAAMTVRERVLLPFLMAPVAATPTRKTETTATASRASSVATHSLDGQVRRLYRLGELEKRTAWRTRHHDQRLGELRQVLASDTQSHTGSGNGLGYSGTAGSDAVFIGNSPDSRRDGLGPLVLLNDGAFVECVLLPLLSAYATRHCGICPETALYVWQSKAKKERETLSVRNISLTHTVIAVAAHYRRIRSSWQSRGRSAAVREVGAAGLLAVVPILPFLSWTAELARDHAENSRRTRVMRDTLTLTTADLVVALQYFTAHSDLLDVLHGDRTTVAFTLTSKRV